VGRPVPTATPVPPEARAPIEPAGLAPVYAAIREEALAIARAVEPYAAEADAATAIHPAVRAALAGSELGTLLVPAGWGGRFERVDPLAVVVVREALMGTSAHLDALFGVQGVGSYAVSAAGSAAQRAEWLPAIARFDRIAALALTEDGAGSDLKAVTTTVREHAGALVLEGRKTWISNAGAADVYVVLCREGDGHSLVLVPAATPGVSTAPGAELIAAHVIGEVAFDSVRLAGTARLGPPGGGFEIVLETLAVFRASVAGAAVGLADAALREAARHSAAREQFGRPLWRLGPVAQLLAESWTELTMARLLTYHAAERARHDARAALPLSSMAKLAATEAAGRIVDRCVQVMGRWGLVHDAKIERLYRQARPLRIYEGASEVLRLSIARALIELQA
jgi:acyl-CoA dehydrogenase